MTKKLTNLINQIEKLYENSDRDIAKWMFNKHVKVVASWCQKISKVKKGNSELCLASAYLHDMSDIWINRTVNHDSLSLEKSQKLLQKNQFSKIEIKEIIGIISTHSAYKNNPPKTLDQKILSTADALVHLNSDFYLHFLWNHWSKHSLADYKIWLIDKIERDYNDKIFWPEYKLLVKPKYEALKQIFS